MNSIGEGNIVYRTSLRYGRGLGRSLKLGFVVLASLAAIFTPPLFFSVSGLIDYQYGGAEESPIYVQYVVFVFIAIVMAYLVSYIKIRKITNTELGFYLFFLFLIGNHLAWVMLDNETRLWNDNLIFFLSMGIIGFFAARVIYAFDAWREVIRLTECVAIVIAIGLLITIVQPFLGGFQVRGIGGASYQAASYYAAMCFGLIGIATFRLERDYRYRVCRTWVFTVLNITLMVGLFVATLLNGGRGAFVLLTLYLLLVIYWIATKHGMTYRGLARFSVVALAVPVGLILAFQKITQDPLLASGFNRAIAFLASTDGRLIDLEGGSSGRDHVYAVALRGIAESPWLGHGAFGHWEKVIHPHNLFFDLVLQFGVPVAFMLVLIVGALVLIRLKPMSTEKVWLLTLSLYPFVNLMFSSGYFRTSLFWFALAGFFMGTSGVQTRGRRF